MPGKLAWGGENFISFGQLVSPQRWGKRNWHMGARYARDRPVEIFEQILGQYSRQFGTNTAGKRILVHNQYLVGVLDRLEYCLAVKRRETAQVNHLDIQVILLFKHLRGF